MVTVADSSLLDTIPSSLQLNNTNWLEYNHSAPHHEAHIAADQSSDLSPFDDVNLVPHDHMPLLPEPDLEIVVTVQMQNLITGDNYAFLNDITYTKPKVPTLYTVLSSGNESNNAAIYGRDTHPFVLQHNQVVQIVLQSNDTGSHPFHLHGHNFQVITRQPSYGPDFLSLQSGDPVPYDPSNHTAFHHYPMRRDVAVLPPNGYYVIRFVADNPGVWFFHCHIDWHLSSGLAMLMIEAPTQMQERMTIPQEHFDVCKAAGIPYEGNAAGRTGERLLDLSGVPSQPGWIPGGFTARGIVAMSFSVFSAFLGIVFIIAYGLSGVHREEGSEREADRSAPLNGVTSNVITELVVSPVDRDKS
jgi:iron transport multicopper oxidase